MNWILKLILTVGVWLIIAPWILRFASVTPALWNSLIIGSSLCLTALWGRYGNETGNNDNSSEEL